MLTTEALEALVMLVVTWYRDLSREMICALVIASTCGWLNSEFARGGRDVWGGDDRGGDEEVG